MKVYSLPDELEFVDPDYPNYDQQVEDARQERHKADLKAWLLANGYVGENTGRIFAKPHADGHALYMYGDGPKAALFHLPYGDAWHSPDVQYLPKREVLKRMGQEDAKNAMFSKAA